MQNNSEFTKAADEALSELKQQTNEMKQVYDDAQAKINALLKKIEAVGA